MLCRILLGVQNTRGTLEEGKRADFLIVKQDPLLFPTALTQEKRVFVAGKEVIL